MADDQALDGHPDRARDQEGERQRHEQRQVDEARGHGAQRLLHDEGGVGAEHDHFAMGHVDHAHHAEGDGKADGREQQHRTERKAVPDVLDRLPERERAAHGAGGVIGRLADQRRRVGPERADHGQRLAVAAPADRRDRLDPLGIAGPGIGDEDGGARLFHHASDARVAFPGERGGEPGEGAGVARLEDGFGRGEPAARIGVRETERAHGGIDGAPDGVVEPDRARALRRGGRFAGRGDQPGAGGRADIDAAIGRPIDEAAVAQRFDHRRGLGKAGSGEGGDAGSDLVEIVGCEPLHQRAGARRLVLRERRRGAGGHHGQRQKGQDE